MSNPTFTVTTDLWVWTKERGQSKWHFLSIKGEVGEQIKAYAILARMELGLSKRGGWGAVKVQASIGESLWQTSIFPGANGAAYMLPVKAPVRKAEGIVAGDEVCVTLELI